MKRARQKNDITGDYFEMVNRNAGKKKRSSKKKVLLIILCIILAVILIAWGLLAYLAAHPKGALVPVDMDKGKLNVLLLGVDEDGMRTDAMMLVSYDLKNKEANLLSIPRDTKIEVSNRKVSRKITEVHAMHNKDNEIVGVDGSIKAVSALTSMPIHYYVEFNFDAIDEISNIIGPITFDVPDVEGGGRGMNYDDPYQDLHIHLKPGVQELVGNEVQQFLRYRKTNSGVGDGSDISRVKRQQDFLKAAVDQKLNWRLIGKSGALVSAVKSNVKTNFGFSDVLAYLKYLKGFSSDKMHTYSLPGESRRIGGVWYFVCDVNETKKLIKTFGYDAKNISTSIKIS